MAGELAIPIGLHIGWNFTIGLIYGFPVSGVDRGLSLFASNQSGPAIWTGGAFGPEGGILGILIVLTGMVLVSAWVRWTRGLLEFKTKLASYEVKEKRTTRATSPMAQL